MKKSITVMVAAYNEEKNLTNTVNFLDKILNELLFEDYEILIFNDCSTDKTAMIANNLAQKNKNIRVIHNKKNEGLGYNYRTAVKLAQKEYFTWFPGDDDVDHESIKNALKYVGKTDVIVPFIANQKERPFFRRTISKTFVFLLNLFFGLRLKYFNGFVISKTEFLKNIHLTANSFAFQAEALIKLIKNKHSYIEVPYKTIPQKNTSAFRFKNLVGVAKTTTNLFFNIRFKKKK